MCIKEQTKHTNHINSLKISKAKIPFFTSTGTMSICPFKNVFVVSLFIVDCQRLMSYYHCVNYSATLGF